MKAIVQDAYGRPADVLRFEEVDVPAVDGDEVLVRVDAAAVAGDDWHLMRGQPYVARGTTGLRRPKRRIPGGDVAGRVDAVGSGATRFRVGDEVFGCRGGFAEYVAVPEDALAPKPANLTPEEAAAVPVSAITALQALRDKGEVQPWHKVLIIGASGGVGTFAVQIAKALGAEVTGVCGTRNLDLVRSIGADRVIDYTREDFSGDGHRYDVIVDLVGDRPLSACRRALAPSGTLVMVGGSGGRWLKGLDRWARALLLSPFVRHRLRPLVHEDRAQDLADVKDLIEAGKLTPVVSARYALVQVPEAIGHFAEGHARGKVVVTVR